MSKHRAGVHEGFLAKHKLKLMNLNSVNAKKILEEIDEMTGVDGVWADLGRSVIKIAYDASHHDIDEMIGVIRKHEADVSEDWWNQWKLRWDRQIDQNIQDNANHHPHCCNKLPPGRR